MDLNVPGKSLQNGHPMPSRPRTSRSAPPPRAPHAASISSLTNKIIQATPDAIVVVDLDHRILTVNPAFCKLWGYSLSDVEGQPARILYDPKIHFDQMDPRNYHFHHETGRVTTFAHPYRRKDGSFFHGETHGAPVKDYHGKIIGYIGTTRVSNPNSHLREALHANDALLKLNFDKANDAILWATPKEGVIGDCNRAAETLLRTAKANIIGRPLAVFLPPATTGDPALRTEEYIGWHNSETEIIAVTGESIPVRISATLIMTSGNLLIQCILHDISKEKQVEQAQLTNLALEKMISERTSELEDANTALRVLVKQIEMKHEEIAGNILNRVRELIAPNLHKLEETKLTEAQEKLITTMRHNLDALLAPLNRTLATALRSLTQTEIQVSAHIVNGKRTKEIAEAMNLSPWTVDVHRRNIRKKCNITNKSVNLRTALAAMLK